VPLAHIAASMHEGLLGTPAERPGTQDAWLNIIAKRCIGTLLDRETGHKSLRPSLLDRHKHARILPQNGFCRGAIESSYLNQQTTDIHPSA
jgi:hypothetical protein